MNVQTLYTLLELKQISAAQLANKAGISRKTLSAWKSKALKSNNPKINVYSHIQNQIETALKISPGILERSLIIHTDKKTNDSLTTQLLWDQLYFSIEIFILALLKGHPKAIARLVQVFGIYASYKLLGIVVWKKFPQYKAFIHPAYRKKTEVLWNLEQSQV